MIKHLLQANRRRVPIKYALIAAALAAVSVVALESAGTALTSSYSGLGGKLTPATAGASDVAPAASPDVRRTLK
jgi:Flp pilus assembly pilin Flp